MYVCVYMCVCIYIERERETSQNNVKTYIKGGLTEGGSHE